MPSATTRPRTIAASCAQPRRYARSPPLLLADTPPRFVCSCAAAWVTSGGGVRGPIRGCARSVDIFALLLLNTDLRAPTWVFYSPPPWRPCTTKSGAPTGRLLPTPSTRSIRLARVQLLHRRGLQRGAIIRPAAQRGGAGSTRR